MFYIVLQGMNDDPEDVKRTIAQYLSRVGGKTLKPAT